MSYSKKIKETIIRNAVASAMKKRYESLKKKEAEYATAAYEVNYGQYLKKMKALPAKMFLTTNKLRITAVDGNGKTHSVRAVHEGRREEVYCLTYELTTKKPVLLGVTDMYSRVMRVEKSKELELFAGLTEFEYECAELVKDANALASKVGEMVYAASSAKKLLELWPEAKAFIPDEAFPDRSSKSLAVRPEDLNKAIACFSAGKSGCL